MVSNATLLQNWQDIYKSQILNFEAPITTPLHQSGENAVRKTEPMVYHAFIVMTPFVDAFVNECL